MKITKTPTAVTPRYADIGSAGMDLYVDTAKEYILKPGETNYLPTGIKMEIPKNYVGKIYPRSSLHKKGLILANQTGIIDSSYRGEIMLAIKNESNNDVIINGQRGLRVPLAQLIIEAYRYEKLEIVDEGELSTTSRGEGGFGSTDGK